jgi:hypothetical protein
MSAIGSDYLYLCFRYRNGTVFKEWNSTVSYSLVSDGFHTQLSNEILSLVHTAMKDFPGEIDLQIVCCGALCYITEDQGNTKDSILRSFSCCLLSVVEHCDVLGVYCLCFRLCRVYLSGGGRNENSDVHNRQIPTRTQTCCCSLYDFGKLAKIW